MDGSFIADTLKQSVIEIIYSEALRIGKTVFLLEELDGNIHFQSGAKLVMKV